jgi:AsmA protein
MTWRRIVLLAVVAVVLAVVAAAMVVPLRSLRGPIEAAASQALDRDVRIAGSLHLTLFPDFGISLKNVSIANSPGAHDPDMVTVGKIVVGAKLMPLLSGRLVTTKVVLKEPVIHLELGKDGVANWQFGARTQGIAENPFSDGRLGIKNAKIENGEVTYFDATTGKTQTLSAVSLTLAMSGPKADGHKLTIDGTAKHDSVPLKLAASLDDLDGFIKGGASKGRVQIGSPIVNADFSGQLAVGGTLDGNVSLNAPSLRRLAGWAGHPLPPGNGFGTVALTAAVAAKDGVYTLSKADIALDRMKLAGTLAIDARPAVPVLNGSLNVDHIDARPYLAPGSNEDLSKAAQGPGTTTRLSLGALKSADADLKLWVGSLALPNLTIKRAVVAALLKKGILQAQLTSFSAYGGAGKGSVTLDPSGAVPTLRAVVDMNGVRVETFLSEMAAVRRIAGSGAIHLDIASRGQSEIDIVRNLSGRGSLTITNGSIAGADLGAVARLVQSTLTGSFLTGAVGDNARTSFGSLSAGFTIAGGVVRVGELRLVNPAVEMTGTGTINLANRQIDFRFEPHALQGVPGLNLVDIGIPFYVRGSWDNPSFAPDTTGLAKGIVGTVGNIGSKAIALPGAVLRAPGDVLDSLFGGN